MRSTLIAHSLRKLLSRKGPVQGKNFLSWSAIGQVILILEQEEGLSRQEIDQLIKQLDRHVEIFYIESRAKHPSYADWLCFTRKQRNFFSMPKKEVLREVHRKNTDLVINTTLHHPGFSSALATAVQSRLVCASSDQQYHFDLLVERSQKQSLPDYLKQVVHYLNMIRTV